MTYVGSVSARLTRGAPFWSSDARMFFPHCHSFLSFRFRPRFAGFAWEIPLGSDEGLPSSCVLKPEWIRIVERVWLGPVIASLPERLWPAVRASLLDVLGLQ
jgi:hypothetical protein